MVVASEDTQLRDMRTRYGVKKLVVGHVWKRVLGGRNFFKELTNISSRWIKTKFVGTNRHKQELH